VPRYPLPHTPNGWYAIARSEDLARGEVRAVRYFARDLVLYRGESGEPRLFDAYCPHLGAHLGVGGTVCGSGIRCPFHGWRFGSDGRLVEVPGLEADAKALPPATLAGYPIDESNGVVFAWFHADGAEPDWEVPVFRETDSGRWGAWQTRGYTVKTHVQDMAENILDRAHFFQVHDMEEAEQRAFDVRFDGPFMIVEQTMKMSSGPSAGVAILAKTTNCGPGMSFVQVDLGKVATLALVAHTPVEQDRVELNLSFCVTAMADTEAMQHIQDLNAEIVNGQFRQDIPIWENKIYRERPMLTAVDGPITQYRRWFRQFYGAARANGGEA